MKEIGWEVSAKFSVEQEGGGRFGGCRRQPAGACCTTFEPLVHLRDMRFLLAILAVCGATPNVTYDARSLLLDGRRVFTFSGSVHYQRLHPTDWPRVLALTAELGFNAIQTYVFWDEHEPTPGSVSFSGKNNLTAFTALAASFNLRVNVRIGPYICGEHFNGGIPQWVRASSPQCFRCSDPAWEAFSTRVLRLIVGELTAAGQLWTQGGPVFMLQVENEYGGSDIKYLADMVAAARALTTDVPWILCHDVDQCGAVNAQAGVAGGAALCTINGFWMEQKAPFVNQPSPSWVAAQRKLNPEQPLAWTEDQGWFDEFGLGQRVRYTSDILYGVARSFAYGFTHHNFYMLTGGANFGYSAADGVTTAYAPDTAIDYLLLRHEPKFSTFASFFRSMAAVADALLAAPVPTPAPLGAFCEVAEYEGGVTFLSNLATVGADSEAVVYRGATYFMPNHTVVLLGADGAVLFNTSAAPDAAPSPHLPHSSAAAPASWTTIIEHLGYGENTAAALPGAPPREQIALTENFVDYAYYSLNMTSPLNASALHITTCGGEYVYVFAGGSGVPLLRDQTPSSSTSLQPRSRHVFLLPQSGAALRLDVLVSAMGMSTSPTPKSCKGLVKVVAGGKDLTNDGWVTHWVFAGEAAQVYTPQGAANAPWVPVAANGGGAVTSWFRAEFDLPPPPPSASASAGSPPQLAYALDMIGATKGVVWVNGFNLGRYNLEAGVCQGACAPPQHGDYCYIHWRNCGLPTQRYYYVPSSLLTAKNNLVVLFEETAHVPVAGEGPAAPSPPPASASGRGGRWGIGQPRDLTTVALVALDAHP